MNEYAGEYSHGMYVVREGPRQGPPLLLIHGSGASGAFWGPVVPALAGRHQVIRVDLPGCGQSPPPRSYAVPDQAGRVAALLDDLGLGPAAVAGHSSGGYVATALAEQRPDLVRALALISSGPLPGALLPQPLLLRLLLAPPVGPLLESRRVAHRPTRPPTLAKHRGGVDLAGQVVHVEIPADDVMARAYVQALAAKVEAKELVEKLGPKLLAVLESLGATPAARGRMKGGASNAAPSQLERLRQARGSRPAS